MQFPYTYFEDEVRDGFYVPSTMKRAWAAQLEVLDDIRKVCEKHHIQYFAGWGTLLGAVRHGGFIPWDDDMDIWMKRDDYNRFLAVAEKELPKGYRLMSFRNDDYWEMLTRVLNGKEIRYDEAHLEKFHGFPFVVGMDIFPLDFLSTDEEEEKLRDDLINFVASVADTFENADVEEDEKERKLCEVERLCNVTIDRDGGVKRQLYILMDQLFSLYGEDEAKYITVMPVWLRAYDYKMPKSYYQETVMLPFENTQVPVPAAYDAVLRASYGDYMVRVHDWGTHDYPFYKRQEEQLARYGIKPQKYVFSADELTKGKRTVNKTVKKQAVEMVNLLHGAHIKFRQAVENGNTTEALGLLEKCQGGAISLGNMIEDSQGRGGAAVGMLEEYCEMIYQIHEGLAQGMDVCLDEACGNLQRQMQSIGNHIEHDIKQRIEVVFLPYKASMWDSLESVWRAAQEDPDCDAYVVPIPFYDKNLDGSFHEMHYEGDQYPDDVPVTWYEDYDFAGRKPDMIFIHNPYDEFNGVTSVHPFFYAKNLKQFTANLIYIPYFILDEIIPNTPQERKTIQCMEYFVTVPGVVHADKVIVQSEGMRQLYVDVLADFAGEDTRKIWEEKILGLGSPKFDKVQEAKKDSARIPDKWREIIRKIRL